MRDPTPGGSPARTARYPSDLRGRCMELPDLEAGHLRRSDVVPDRRLSRLLFALWSVSRGSSSSIVFLVTVSWLVLLIAGGAAAGPTAGRLSFDFSLPGQPGYQTEQQLIATFGTSTADTVVPVLTVPAGDTVQQHAADVAAVWRAVRTRLPQLRIVDLTSTGDPRFITADGRSTFALVQGPAPKGFGPGISESLTPVLQAAAKSANLRAGVTSYGLLSQGGDTGGPSVLVETLFGALGALAVLVFVFASFLALVPLVIAAVSILTTFLLVLGLTYLTDVSFVVQFLIALVGLGVAIDYSLLLVSRWREERAHGLSNDEAVVRAVQTAGHAVFASGVTVAISLLALVVVPVPFLRSMGSGRHAHSAGQRRRRAHAPACAAVQDRSAGGLAANPAR